MVACPRRLSGGPRGGGTGGSLGRGRRRFSSHGVLAQRRDAPDKRRGKGRRSMSHTQYRTPFQPGQKSRRRIFSPNRHSRQSPSRSPPLQRLSPPAGKKRMTPIEPREEASSSYADGATPRAPNRATRTVTTSSRARDMRNRGSTDVVGQKSYGVSPVFTRSGGCPCGSTWPSAGLPYTPPTLTKIRPNEPSNVTPLRRTVSSEGASSSTPCRPFLRVPTRRGS
jgi:hypothetical protein